MQLARDPVQGAVVRAADRRARLQPGRPGASPVRVRQPGGELASSAATCGDATTSSGSTRAASAGPRRSTASATASSTPSSAASTRRPTRRPRSRGSSPRRRSSPTDAPPRTPKIIAHVSTVDAARDMDVLRAALGRVEAQLPRRLLRHLPRRHLRRAVPRRRWAGSSSTAPVAARPHGPGPGDRAGQGLRDRHPGVRRRLRRARRDCPVGQSRDEGMAWIRDFLKGLDAQPLPVTNDQTVTAASPRAGRRSGSSYAMYDQRRSGPS